MISIAIIDYGMGNLWSVSSAIKYLGYEAVITSCPDKIKSSDILILPGVGSYRLAMEALHKKNLIDPLKEAVCIKERKILGICLGMRLMTDSSTEDGLAEGLGYFEGSINRFDHSRVKNLKVPHIGFNLVRSPSDSILFSGLDSSSYYYFVHSYCLEDQAPNSICSISNHGYDFVAAFERDNFFGTQFHPEKSQTNGLKLLQNFIRC